MTGLGRGRRDELSSTDGGRPMTSLGVSVHPTAVLAPNVEIGNGSIVGEYVVLGRAPRGHKEGELRLVIGPGSVIRPFTTIYAGTTIGARLQTGQGASIREDNIIGDDVSIGTHASLEFGNRLGSRIRVHTGCFLELVTVEDDVFLGPHVVFTDDPHPQCPAYLDCVRGATVRRRARIGGNATILPGVQIGEDALVGAGSVVRHAVAARSVVAGNPAKELKDDIAKLECFAGIYPHAYSWLEPLPDRASLPDGVPLADRASLPEGALLREPLADRASLAEGAPRPDGPTLRGRAKR